MEGSSDSVEEALVSIRGEVNSYSSAGGYRTCYLDVEYDFSVRAVRVARRAVRGAVH
jgi:hypothetical protein